jgi:mono/diheme cytochrome c family protein
MRGGPAVKILLAACGLLALAGCERRMQDMYRQPRYDPGEASTLWRDGKAARAPVPGTVPQAGGDLASTSSGRRTGDAAGSGAGEGSTGAMAMLKRGQQRYAIFCLPCHGLLGDGSGPVVERGFPRPPSYHDERLRRLSDQAIFEVITQGHGVMPSYAARVPVPDRWAIVSYLRALQLSQHARVDELPPAMASALQALPPSGAASAAKATP